MKHLTRLRNLTLSNNNIRLNTDEDIDELKGTNVSVLSFRNCGLIRIPGTLSKLKALTEVDFSVNQIRTVERYDLQYLRFLRKLVLADNPIVYIASSSFYRLDRVSVLDLSNTSLSTLPDAIVNLYSLTILYLEHTPIECTCELYWLKRWLVIYGRHLTIYGQCEKHRPIRDKIRQ